MNLSDIVNTVRSGVVHIIHKKDGKRLGSGTGFMVNGFLVTNDHVCSGLQDSVVLIRFHNSSISPDPLSDGYEFPYKEFINRIKSSSSQNSYDFAVIDMPELKNHSLYDFSFGEPAKKRIGETVFFLGYPFEHFNLVCHAGIISSFHRSSVAEVIQIDASVNGGNSGGPLIDVENGKVIGIITRRETGLTKVFKELRLTLESNIQLLKATKSKTFVSNVDLFQHLSAGQSHLLKLTNEIERSANVGIGYAFSIEQLQQEQIFSSGI